MEKNLKKMLLCSFGCASFFNAVDNNQRSGQKEITAKQNLATEFKGLLEVVFPVYGVIEDRGFSLDKRQFGKMILKIW